MDGRRKRRFTCRAFGHGSGKRRRTSASDADGARLALEDARQLSGELAALIARLERADTGGASHVTFVVRDDDGASEPDAAAKPAFVRKAERAERWRSPCVRLALWALAPSGPLPRVDRSVAVVGSRSSTAMSA